MNEKYVQALIVGSLIGGAILLDDFVKPKKENSMNKHVIIKSDFKEGDLPDVKDIHSIDVLQNMDIIKGLDLEGVSSEVLGGLEEALEAIEDVDVQIKLEIKKENKEED
ncbi:MAG: hypothetical protein VW894_06915 [Gammaproteobacteria bacterium]|jgi:hypothetical protein